MNIRICVIIAVDFSRLPFSIYIQICIYSVDIILKSLNRKKVKHRLEFDDGGREWVDVNKEQVRHIQDSK